MLSWSAKHPDDTVRVDAAQVARVLDGLPVGIRAGVVAFQFDHDQLPIRVNRQEVEPRVRLVKAAELLADDQQVLTQDARVIGNPLLDVSPLLESQFSVKSTSVTASDVRVEGSILKSCGSVLIWFLPISTILACQATLRLPSAMFASNTGTDGRKCRVYLAHGVSPSRRSGPRPAAAPAPRTGAST